MTTTDLVLATSRNREFKLMFQRGDVAGMLATLRNERPDDADDSWESEQLARLAVELRRHNVATIGQHEAFVITTGEGRLRQVIAPVRLSVADRTLWQMPSTEKDPSDPRGKRKLPLDPNSADITAQGLTRLNAVAGCAVHRPPSIMVDGAPRSNPYFAQDDNANLTRVVVAVNVVGPSPKTGNPIVVQYTLDMDPRRELLRLLLTCSKWKGMAGKVFLMDEDAWNQQCSHWEMAERAQWTWLRLDGRIGVAANLRNDVVRDQMSKYLEMLITYTRKAQTQAERNAMRKHPALAFSTVRVDPRTREAIVAVTGWQREDGIEKMADVMGRLAAGLDPGVEVIEADEIYDAANEDADHLAPSDVGGSDVEGMRAATRPPAGTDGDGVSEEEGRDDGEKTQADERSELVAQIASLVGFLSDEQSHELGFDPETGTVEELREQLSLVQRWVDEDLRSTE